MRQRYQPTKAHPVPSHPPFPADPWHAASTPRDVEPAGGGWLLSYLDVMTLLFAFFVLLFAYQKAMTPSAKPQKVPAAASTKIQGTARATTAPDSNALIIAAMKSQAGVRAITANTRPTPGVQAASSTPADHVQHTAPEHTAQLVAQAFQRETARQQVEVVREGRQVRVEMSDAVLFDPGSADLRGDGLAMLDRLLPALSGRTDALLVEGHTDPTPIANARFPSNWELSSARATAVTRYLVGKGLPASRLRAVGLADTRPRADNTTPENRARNRRVTVVVGEMD
jgi:chemotaxis protein MotB